MKSKIQPELDGLPYDQASLGAFLESGRKAKGLSIEQVSEAIRVPVDKVQALESGCFEELPQLPFLKGIIQAYAKVVGIGKTELASKLTIIDEATKHQPGRLAQIREPSDVKLSQIDKPSFYITSGKIALFFLAIAVFFGMWFGLDYFNDWAKNGTRESVVLKQNERKQEIDAAQLNHSLVIRSKVPNFIKFLEGNQESSSKGSLVRTFVGPERMFKKEDISVSKGVLWSLYPRALEVVVNNKPLKLIWKGQLASLDFSTSKQ